MKKSKIPVSVLLITVLFISPPQVAHSDDTQQACGAPCIIAAAALIVGGILFVSLRNFCKKHLPPPQPDPPPPNNRTNHASLFAPNQAAGLVLSDEAVELIDISTNNWHDEYGNLYAISFNTVLQTSTNLLNWEFRYAITGYVSFATVNGQPIWSAPSNSCSVYFDASGAPVGTNWSTDADTLPVEPASQARFYRLAHD
jgi:hypothetical protein